MKNDAATAFEKYYANNLSFIGILPKAEGDFTLDELDIEGLLESDRNTMKLIVKCLS